MDADGAWRDDTGGGYRDAEDEPRKNDESTDVRAGGGEVEVGACVGVDVEVPIEKGGEYAGASPAGTAPSAS